MTLEQNSSENLDALAKRKSQLTNIFLIMAISLIIVSGIHLFSIINSGFSSVALADTVYHLVSGVIVFICSRLLKRGNRLVIYLLGAEGVIAVLYGFLMGRGFNFILVIIIGYFVWQVSDLAKKGGMDLPSEQIDELKQN